MPDHKQHSHSPIGLAGKAKAEKNAEPTTLGSTQGHWYLTIVFLLQKSKTHFM
jgi:hypothetical protein